jgi:hypothetical protein
LLKIFIYSFKNRWFLKIQKVPKESEAAQPPPEYILKIVLLKTFKINLEIDLLQNNPKNDTSYSIRNPGRSQCSERREG